ncbi:NACHT, LRR and PYD domains-containing protein 3-like isoform X2 [Mobula birostris]|uniref:NACHT, LRR and PYD domains-containing protein 3-like isoform X2 n=1 Tax=Mobula birostris TaxID=1983395 RepID=UPI003B289B93
MGGGSSQPQSADKPAEQGAQSSGTAEHQENACSAQQTDKIFPGVSIAEHYLQSSSSSEEEESEVFPHRHLRHHLKNLSLHQHLLRCIPHFPAQQTDKIFPGVSIAEHYLQSSSSSEEEESEVFPHRHLRHHLKNLSLHQHLLRCIPHFPAQQTDKIFPGVSIAEHYLQSSSSSEEEESEVFPHRHLRHHLKNLSLHQRKLRCIPHFPDTDAGIFELLARCTDYQLFQLINFYRERLKPAIEDRVEELVCMLEREGHFSRREHKQVIELTEKGHLTESSRLLLSLVMEKGPKARRATWECFAKMRNELPKLDKILKEIQEFGPDPYEHVNIARPFWDLSTDLKGVQQKHKETLRAQTETLRVNTILMREKEKVFQMADQYAELTVISTVRDRRLVEHELLARGREHERWRKRHLRGELEKIRTDQFFQSSFSRSKSQSGNSAAVAGVTGIGKTTIVQKIVYDWATGKIYQQFQFVFSFKFRDLNLIKCRIALKELILNQYPYFGNNLREIWNNPEGLLFIFDGLNEFKHNIDFADSRRDTEPKHQCPDPEWWCEVSDIVYSLIQGKLLPGCSVLVTTRPTALHLLEKAKISVWAEILGFVGEERKEYFIRHFEDQTVAAAVFKHVEENEILYTMSFNPSYCWILALALGPFFTQRVSDPQRVPKTITQLYSYYIYNILKNHGHEIENPRDVFLRLGEMAFRGVAEKKIVFTDADLSNYNLQPSQFLSGFLMELLEREDSARSVVYTFPHITIQEFVAALAQFLNPHPADILKSLSEIHGEEDGRFEVFLRFVVGLSSPMTTRGLQEFLGPFPHQTTCQVIDWVKEEIERQIENAGSETGKRSLLNTLHYLFESQNRGLTQATLGSVITLSFSELRLTPIDCAVLSYVIGICETIKHLELWNCRIQCEGLQRLGPVLHKCLELRLGNNELGDSGVRLVSAALRNPECKIQKLGLDQVRLTDSGAEDLSSALGVNRSLTELDLSYNNGLGDSGVILVTAALGNPECKIQRLTMGRWSHRFWY